MSHLLPRTRPARPALRRAADRVQFGLDPHRATTVEGLSGVASSALPVSYTHLTLPTICSV